MNPALKVDSVESKLWTKSPRVEEPGPTAIMSYGFSFQAS